MIVEWRSGAKCYFANLNTNQFLEVEEGCTYYPLSVSNPKIGTDIALQNVPNPFTDLTKITYTISDKADVSLVVTDVTGKKVIDITNKAQGAGTYETVITSQQLSQTGVYFYSLTVGREVFSGKMLFTGN